MTGEFTPLIFLSLFHTQAPRILILLCFSFFCHGDFSLRSSLFSSGWVSFSDYIVVGGIFFGPSDIFFGIVVRPSCSFGIVVGLYSFGHGDIFFDTFVEAPAASISSASFL